MAHFWPFIRIKEQKKIFLSENPALSRTTPYGFLAPCQISEKTYDTIPRKCLDRKDGRMEGEKDGQTVFYRTFPATPRVQKLTDMKTYRWTQKQRKKIKKPTLSLVNAGPPGGVSVLSTKCGGCHPKGLIVASSYKVKQIIVLIIILVLLDKNKNQLKLLCPPLVPSNFWN